MYEIKKFDNLLGLQGFSDQLLNNHFTLYEGYVNNTNKLLEEFVTFSNEDKMSIPAFAELKRRFGWEFNGMRLHELYFSNLTKDAIPLSKDSTLYQKIETDYGSFANWEKEFRSTGAMRGIGWVILYFDQEADKLVISWINEHDTGHLTGLKPLLIMDAFEHAYMIDYGLKKADYINAFFGAINWSVVEQRF